MPVLVQAIGLLLLVVALVATLLIGSSMQEDAAKASSALALASAAFGAPGDALTVEVQVPSANVRARPATDAPVVAWVREGRLLPVLERGDAWVRVGLDGGRDGWIHGALVAPAGAQEARAAAPAQGRGSGRAGAVAAPDASVPSPEGKELGDGAAEARAEKAAEAGELLRFEAEVERVNERVRRVAGIGVFAGVEDLGGGAVALAATEAWHAAPEAARRANLETLARLWAALRGPGAPAVVRVVDDRGEAVMEERRGGEPAAFAGDAGD